MLRDGNIEILKRLGTVVWLEAPVDILLERASRRRTRPLLQTENPQAKLSELLAVRRPFYEQAADLRVDTGSLNHGEVADLILRETQSLLAKEGL